MVRSWVTRVLSETRRLMSCVRKRDAKAEYDVKCFYGAWTALPRSQKDSATRPMDNDPAP
jgi:hypothetical protein